MPTEISLAIGPGVLSIGAVIGVTYAFIRSYRRGRSPSETTTGTVTER